jgi:hypothetical protein
MGQGGGIGAGAGVNIGSSAGHQAKHAWQMAQAGYWSGRYGIKQDPFLKSGLWHTRDLARQDLMGLGRAIGNQQADIQARALQDALAARGGGNLQSALSLGSQARVGAGLQGLQAGFQMQQGANQALVGASTARLNLLNQLYGALQGVATGMIGASAQLGAAGAKSSSALWSSIIDRGQANMSKPGYGMTL